MISPLNSVGGDWPLPPSVPLDTFNSPPEKKFTNPPNPLPRDKWWLVSQEVREPLRTLQRIFVPLYTYMRHNAHKLTSHIPA